MMNFVRLIGLCGLLLAVGHAHAATFSVNNRGSQTVWVRPSWGSATECYTELQPGQSRTYDSGFYKVYKIAWVQKFPNVSNQLQGTITIKSFAAEVDIGVVNLGAQFDIQNDGSYKYNFGVQGSGDSVAKTLEGI